jgi:alpha-glucuronidase
MDNHAEFIKLCAKNLVACDEKLEKIENSLGFLLGLEKSLELISSKDELVECDKVINKKVECRILNIQNNIKLLKVNKFIYKAIIEKKSSKYLEKLMEKYDELLGTSIEIAGDLVLNEVVVEGEYLDFCKNSLKQREFIKMVCDYGIRVAKEEEDK